MFAIVLEHCVAQCSGLPDHLEVVLGFQEQTQPGADDSVIVDDDNTNHGSGTSATRLVPITS